jgi:sensor histidine kinase regulating citrate/malate metabolism
MQIFQRSFSTKGVNRGIGTYSIKLFTERYLRGKAWFTTDKLNGTNFYVKYPIYQK